MSPTASRPGGPTGGPTVAGPTGGLTGGLTIAGATRRLVTLTALRWLPTGLMAPVTVLLATDRGLSPTQVGVVFTVFGAVVVALELPTGGLADALGRRAVLVAGALAHAAGLLALAVAADQPGFVLAAVLVGTGRALDSGPLEAWYVDTVRVLDPAADPARGLSRAGVADGAALSAGVIAAALLPLLGRDLLALPLLVAAALALVQACAVLALLTPLAPAPPAPAPLAPATSLAPPRPRRPVLAALRERLVPAIAGVPATIAATIAATVRLAGADPVLRLLLGMGFGTGVVLATLELLGPLRLAELTGGAGPATSAFGVVLAVSFAAAAIGSGLALRAERAAGSAPLAMALLAVGCALAVAGVAAGPNVALIGVAYAAFYLCNGASWPARKRFLHQRVHADHRATMVSAGSLALQLGAITANAIQPRLYEHVAPVAAFGVAAAALLVMAWLSLRLPATNPTQATEEAAASPTGSSP